MLVARLNNMSPSACTTLSQMFVEGSSPKNSFKFIFKGDSCVHGIFSSCYVFTISGYQKFCGDRGGFFCFLFFQMFKRDSHTQKSCKGKRHWLFKSALFPGHSGVFFPVESTLLSWPLSPFQRGSHLRQLWSEWCVTELASPFSLC